MFSKIIKKFGVSGSDRFDVKKNVKSSIKTSEHKEKNKDKIVLKTMNYNLSYKKEKRQRRPTLNPQRNKLQMSIILSEYEDVQQFNETMKMFGAKWIFVDNCIEVSYGHFFKLFSFFGIYFKFKKKYKFLRERDKIKDRK